MVDYSPSEGLQAIGIGTHPSKGMKKGVVVDIQQTASDIKASVVKAQNMCGREITSVIVGVTGRHIQAFNARGAVAITNYKGEVTFEDVERAIENAKESIPLTRDRTIIQVTPRQFILDGEGGIRYPFGMSAHHLEVDAHIVTGGASFLQNVSKSLEIAGLKPRDILLQPIATGEAVLEEAEKEIGVALLDIGGGTTDLAIFMNGSICYSSAIPIGGNHLTSDIMVGLRVAMEEAERLKCTKGCAMASMVDPSEPIEIQMVAREEKLALPRKILGEIIEARLTELFQVVGEEISKAKVGDMLPAGIVLTGGTSLLPGIEILAEKVLNMPARLGIPKGIKNIPDIPFSPIHSTVVGLVLYAHKYSHFLPKRRISPGNPIARFFKAIYNWIANFLRL